MNIDNFKWIKTLKKAYKTKKMLELKRSIHERFSTVPIDLDSLVIDRVIGANPKSVIDLGCGLGSTTFLLERSLPVGTTIVGFDLSIELIDASKKIATSYDLPILFQQGNIEKLPYEDSSWDVCIAVHCLSHLQDPMRGLKEIYRVLKPGGILVCTANSLKNYPHLSTYRKRLWDLFNCKDRRFTTNIVSAENIKALLSQVFDDVNITNYSGVLEIPVHEFVEWALANSDVWACSPTSIQRVVMRELITNWALCDAHREVIREHKSIAVATGKVKELLAC